MWLEITKLIVAALVPIVVVVVGWKLNRSLKGFEHAQWANQKLVEKKLQLFDEIMPRLNDLYCFYNFVGNWKDITPGDVIAIKRALDKKINVYSAVLGNIFLEAYASFMKCAFETYVAEGADAKIRSVISGYDGDRKMHCSYQWKEEWDSLFPIPASYDKTEFQLRYAAVESAFQSAIGVTVDR